MIRPILVEIGLFLAPFALYAVFLLLTRNAKPRPDAWRASRVTALLGVAIVLVAASFVLLAQFSGARPDANYAPAVFRNGKLVPGVMQ